MHLNIMYIGLNEADEKLGRNILWVLHCQVPGVDEKVEVVF